VLWLGVGGGKAEVIGAQRVVTDRIAGVGVLIDRRPFHPHLTLARWRSSRQNAARRVRSAAPQGSIARVDVDHVTLYQSRLTELGPVHTPLARATLT
jgi:2'-5' RNA ligase